MIKSIEKNTGRYGFSASRPIALATLLASAIGCQLQAASEQSIQVYYRSSQCGISMPTLVLIENQQQWRQLIPQRKILLGPAAPDAPDFDRQSLLLIAAGQKPSGGYQISLLDNKANMVNGELAVSVEIKSPASMASQQVTSPCLLVSIPISVPISGIDAAGMRWARPLEN